MIKNNLPTCGDTEIDNMRQNAIEFTTNKSSYIQRRALLKLWINAMQQQGVSVETMSQYMVINNKNLSSLEKCLYLDKAIAEANKLQIDLTNGKAIKQFENKDGAEPPEDCGTAEDWPFFQKDIKHSGSQSSSGPQKGVCEWKFPSGISWEAAPLVIDDAIYAITPGVRSVLMHIDAKSGNVVKRISPQEGMLDFEVYEDPAAASTPVFEDEEIAYREMGSRGNSGKSKHIIFVDIKTGEVKRKINVGHLDYRALYAPLCRKGDKVIVPYAVHDIELNPPIHQAFDRVRCYNAYTGTFNWEFFTGTTFSEPIMDENFVYVGTREGYVYCIRTDNSPSPANNSQLQWMFQTKGSVNSKILINKKNVYFGSNDGIFYCLDKVTGNIKWQKKLCEADNSSQRLFSSPSETNNKILVGAVNCYFYVLDMQNGDILFKYLCDDWIRSTPVGNGSVCYVATFKGTVYSFSISKKIVLQWKKSFDEHAIVSPLAIYEDNLVYTSSNLFIRKISKDGEKVWEHSLLVSTKIDDFRIFFDQLAGGTYFQSKLTAVNGIVFAGTAMRTLHALDAISGKEYWRCELSGPISAAAAYYNGKLYLGQQGGDDMYYCIDAANGKVLWTQAVGWVWGSSMITDGKVFVPGIDGYVYCLDAENGWILWRFRTSRSTCTEPFVADGAVYFGGWDKYLYKLDINTGKLIWKFFLNAGADSGSASICGDKIFMPTGGSAYRCLNAKTSEILWEFHIDEIANFNSSSAYYGDKVFISIQYGNTTSNGVTLAPKIIALDATNGEKLWETPGGSLTGSVNDGSVVYFGSSSSPFITAVSIKDVEKGAPKVLWRYCHGGRMEESCPAIYAGRLYAYCSDSFIYCIK